MGGYYSIRGRDLWVEDRGGRSVREGTPPILLLHGGLDHSATFLAVFDDTLRQRYRLVAFDRSGCGRSPYIEGCFTIADKATQVVAFIQDYVREPVHIIGHSDGANAALAAALQRPDLIHTMTLIGANFHHEGLMAGSLPPQDIVAESYATSDTARLAPEGIAQAERKARETWNMWATQPTFSAEDVAAIQVPTLVAVGDDEPISLRHTVALYESLPTAQLAVVPAASHGLPTEQPQLLAHLISEFHAAPLGRPTLSPIRRRS
jgi:pimeloyl-ACP methyl ester carboxylesterase